MAEESSVLVIRVLWMSIFITLVAYGVYFVMQKVIVTETNDYLNKITVFDHLNQGVHHLSGIITVPSKCSILSVRVENSDLYTHKLIFTTDNTSHACADSPDARRFSIDVRAIAEKELFSGYMDGEPLTLAVVRK